MTGDRVHIIECVYMVFYGKKGVIRKITSDRIFVEVDGWVTPYPFTNSELRHLTKLELALK